MNSNDPFYPILIPNTPYVKFSLFFFLVVGGSQGVPKISKIFFMISKNYFNFGFAKRFFLLKREKKIVLGVPKVM